MSLSLGDIQQIYTMLQEINRLLADIEVNLERVDQKAKTTHLSMSKALAVASGLLSLLRRMGLPEDANKALLVLQRYVMWMQQLIILSNLMLTATGPVGWVLAGLGIAGAVLSFSDVMVGF